MYTFNCTQKQRVKPNGIYFKERDHKYALKANHFPLKDIKFFQGAVYLLAR